MNHFWTLTHEVGFHLQKKKEMTGASVGSVGLILAKASAMRVTIPIDLSTWSFIPLPRFFNSRRVPPLLNQSLVLIPQHSA